MKKTILIIDDEENMLHMLSSVLGKEGYEVVTASNGQQGLDYASGKEFDYILCDLKMPELDGLAFLQKAKARKIGATIIMMSAYATVGKAVQAMKQGAYDFITKPFKIEEILCIINRADERQQLKTENQILRKKVAEFEGGRSFSSLVGKSRGLKKVIHMAEKAAGYETTVLITGESGTGKELIARGIHQSSGRAEGPFIAVNCGSIPENLLESEFFGYVKGAFTGADSDKNGLFQQADGGTLFLDEVGELPPSLQVKLLRVLQEKEVRPVGALVNVPSDVRIVAATARELEQEMEEGRFRQDLYYRLNVVTLLLPPLRARKEDIALLCDHFLGLYSRQYGAPAKKISREALSLLQGHRWPGNVRELENSIERAVVMAETEILCCEDLPPALYTEHTSAVAGDLQGISSLKEGKKIMEHYLINKALVVTDGNKSKAAQLLEISYPSLLSKIKEL